MDRRALAIAALCVAVLLIASVTALSVQYLSALPSPSSQSEVADWPMFHATPDHRGWTSARVPESATVAWTYEYVFTTPAEVRYLSSSPVVQGGVVYASAGGLHLLPHLPEDNPYAAVALELSDGGPLWHYSYNLISGALSEMVTIQGDKLWIGEGGTTTILRSSNGTVDSEIVGSNRYGVAYTDAAVYLAHYYGLSRVEAYDASDIGLLWSVELDSPAGGAPSVGLNMIAAISQRGTLYGIHAGNGTVSWIAVTNVSSHTTPAIAGNLVVASFEDGTVRAFEVATGSQLWNYSTDGPINSSPAISETRVFVGSDDGHLYALDLMTGALVWRFAAGGKIHSSPALAPNAVVFGSDDCKIYALEPDSGKSLWAYQTESAVKGSPAIVEGYVLVGSDDGRVYAFGGPATQSHPVAFPSAMIWLTMTVVLLICVAAVIAMKFRERIRRRVYR